MIKSIAFDLGGCLLRENDFVMTKEEEILEKEFGNINDDKEYFSWATKTLSLPEVEIKKILDDLWPKLYSLKEEKIFEILLQNFPYMTFAVASNHISDVKKSLEFLWISHKCNIILISWDCWFEKPSEEFYTLLIEKIGLPAEEILFIDDHEENTSWAEKVWLKTLLCHHGEILSESILSYLWKKDL